jgi:predicted TIM-barrel fold metal-dependent hydrolase
MRRQAPRRAQDSWGMDRLLVESRLFPTPEGRGRAPRRAMSEEALAWYQESVAASRDVPSRLRRMDEEGIDASVVLPSQGLVVGAVNDAVLAAAIADAYNAWVWDYCGRAPGRLLPAAIIPRQDVRFAVRAVRRAHEAGFDAVLMRPNPVAGRTLDDQAYDPMWREIEERGLAVLLHEGTGFSPGQTAGIDRYESGICSHLISHPVEQMLAVTSFIFGGILARFPRLRVGFLEAGCGWLPYWLDRMDMHCEELSWEVPWLTMPPSEYFRRQCFVSCEAEDPFIPTVISHLGHEVLVFSTDFPHADHTMTGAVKTLRARADIPQPALPGILGDNCMRLLNRGGGQ